MLTEDQRDLWWKKYGIAIGKPFDGIPDSLRREDMEDVTAQPLLNYLVALSYKRGALDFDAADINLNQIYADLLIGVHKRDYEGERNIHAAELTSHEFGRVLEEIALAVWHGNGRTATVEEIENHCNKSGSSALIKKFEEGAKSGVTRLLTAFYFREEGHSATGERTFEFTHKTFGEYLTAKRIMRGMEKMLKELKERRESFDEGWDERSALQEWAEICGATELDEYVVAFLRREIELKDQDTIKDWQKEISVLINALLKIGLPLERIEGKVSFKEMLRQSRNAEESLLALHCLSASAVEHPKASQIQWTGWTSALEWIKRLQGRQGGNSITSLSLAFLCFDEQVLTSCDLFGANLRGSSFEQASLYMANLQFANLTWANLRYVDMSSVNLRGADLREADLREADLTGALLFDANFANADLTEADLSEAHIAGAKLIDANLNGASLKFAHVERVDSDVFCFPEGNLQKSDLSGADLTESKLIRSNLSGSNLSYADLTNADLRGADLRGANLNGAMFDTSEIQPDENQ